MQPAQPNPKSNPDDPDTDAGNDSEMRPKQVAAPKQSNRHDADQCNNSRIEPAILIGIRRGDLDQTEVQHEWHNVGSHAGMRKRETEEKSACLQPFDLLGLSCSSHKRMPPRKALRLSPMRAPGGSRLRSLAFPPPRTT